MDKAVTELIQQRFSCRRHPEKAIETQTRDQLQTFLQRLPAGPFGSPTRFELIAATEQDRQSLKGVGTYGVIKNAAGFLVASWDREIKTWKISAI